MRIRLRQGAGADGDVERTFEFEADRVRIGRSPEVDVVISGAGAEVVSGRHAALEERNGQVFLSDLQSSNGTYLNGHPVSSPVPVQQGDEIVLGHDGARIRIASLELRKELPMKAAVEPPSVFGYKRSVERGVPIASAPAVVDRASSRTKARERNSSDSAGGTRQWVMEVVSRERRSVYAVVAVLGVSIAILVLGLNLVNRPATSSTLESAQVYRQVLPGTVWILSELGESNLATGTGFLVDSERMLVMTNSHVIDGAIRVRVWFADIDPDGDVISQPRHYLSREGIDAEVVSRDELRDLALVRLPSVPVNARTLRLASRRPSTGETVHTIGNPGSYDEALWVFSTGTVNSYVAKWEGRFRGGKRVVANVLITDHSTTLEGASGGPVVNSVGAVVGINQSVQKWNLAEGSEVPTALMKRFCVDVTEIRDFLNSYSGR